MSKFFQLEASLLPTVKITTGRRPVALSTASLSEPKEGELPQQSIVVVTNGWTVLCYNHKLRLQWESSVQVYIEAIWNNFVRIMLQAVFIKGTLT